MFDLVISGGTIVTAADTYRADIGISDGTTLATNLRQMLPDHAGGTFEAVTSGSRATARIRGPPGA